MYNSFKHKSQLIICSGFACSIFCIHTYPYRTSCLESKIPGSEMSWDTFSDSFSRTESVCKLSQFCLQEAQRGPSMAAGKCFLLMQPLGAALGCSDKRAQPEWAKHPFRRGYCNTSKCSSLCWSRSSFSCWCDWHTNFSQQEFLNLQLLCTGNFLHCPSSSFCWLKLKDFCDSDANFTPLLNEELMLHTCTLNELMDQASWHSGCISCFLSKLRYWGLLTACYPDPF